MRYALYHTPAPGHRLAAAAAAWLGRDPHAGTGCPQPELDWLPVADLETLTADPRRYGFHGTLKAPFRLAQGVRETDLVGEIENLAGATAPVILPAGLKVAGIGPFFALVPACESAELVALASDCVRRFETFRAPLSDAELQRRRRARLSQHQEDLLMKWGYPYVFDEFRFHMTLTGRVPEALRDRMRVHLEALFRDHTGLSYRLDTLSLFSQRSPDEAFRVQATFPLAGEEPTALPQTPDRNLAET